MYNAGDAELSHFCSRFYLFGNRYLSSFFDTIGFLCLGLGLMVYLGFQAASLKVLMVLFLFLFLNPLVTHTLARSANLLKAPAKEAANDK